MNEEALLEAVLAAPDDDAPRLVYADYLQERGDPRGELIVVQCERERLEREDKTTTLEYRRACWQEKALLPRFEGEYRRGFVHRAFVYTPDPAALARLATGPTASLLDTVVLRGDSTIELDAQHALRVAPTIPADEPLWRPEHGLPHPLLVPAVTAVRYSVPTDFTIRALIEVDAPRLRSVTCMNGLRFTGGAFDEYVDTRSYRRLTHLALWRIGDLKAYDYIRRAPPDATHLTIVVDSEGRTQLWTGPALRASAAVPTLRELHVSVGYEVGDVERLVRDAVHLESWSAPDGIHDDARALVATSSLTKRLRHLEMTFAGYPDVTDLVTAPWERLTSLALGNAWIGPELAKAPALETLVSLRLFGCKLAGDVEAAVRARWPHVRIE